MGSAIFLHLAREDFSPTEGCVALSRPDLLRLLALAEPGSAVEVVASRPARPEACRRRRPRPPPT